MSSTAVVTAVSSIGTPEVAAGRMSVIAGDGVGIAVSSCLTTGSNSSSLTGRKTGSGSSAGGVPTVSNFRAAAAVFASNSRRRSSTDSESSVVAGVPVLEPAGGTERFP
jgi:hypothetical protein